MPFIPSSNAVTVPTIKMNKNKHLCDRRLERKRTNLANGTFATQYSDLGHHVRSV